MKLVLLAIIVSLTACGEQRSSPNDRKVTKNPDESVETFEFPEVVVGDRAHGLRGQIRDSETKQNANNSIFLTNATCEWGTISLNNGAAIEAVGCSTDANAQDIALEAFKATEQYITMGWTSDAFDPRQAETQRFNASKVECISNSDRCFFTK